MEVNKLVVVFIIILIFFWIVQPFFNEQFSQNTMEFVPYGDQRYGLRSDPLNYRPIADSYISANRNIRLNEAGGMMFEADNPPQGKHCRKVDCPINTDEFDALDTCWKCGKPGCVSPACASCADCADVHNLKKLWPRK